MFSPDRSEKKMQKKISWQKHKERPTEAPFCCSQLFFSNFLVANSWK
jgi:hypothetical protein